MNAISDRIDIHNRMHRFDLAPRQYACTKDSVDLWISIHYPMEQWWFI